MNFLRVGTVVTAAFLATLACWAARPTTTFLAQDSPAAGQLDFQAYRMKVEPIFLKKRGEHARCYSCHSHNESLFHLQTLAPGQTTFTEEQSRKNFESVMELLTPGDPSRSRILLHPLAPEAGGEAFHSGGRQFETKDDPDWKTIADWIRAGKSGS